MWNNALFLKLSEIFTRITDTVSGYTRHHLKYLDNSRKNVFLIAMAPEPKIPLWPNRTWRTLKLLYCHVRNTYLSQTLSHTLLWVWNVIRLPPTLSGWDIAYAGGWSMWRLFSLISKIQIFNSPVSPDFPCFASFER